MLNMLTEVYRLLSGASVMLYLDKVVQRAMNANISSLVFYYANIC